ncbi:hypothetical protein [Kitasatospora sp. NPDC096140]|uniref:hypothetical protein n=1 Tax=Kitasatospora sp. NPDC096140 TaxID=3155425 RepID=UPI003333B274
MLRGLWTQDVFDFDGRHNSLHGNRHHPEPVQPPGPPILIGGRGTCLLRLVSACSATRRPPGPSPARPTTPSTTSANAAASSTPTARDRPRPAHDHPLRPLRRLLRRPGPGPGRPRRTDRRGLHPPRPQPAQLLPAGRGAVAGRRDRRPAAPRLTRGSPGRRPVVWRAVRRCPVRRCPVVRCAARRRRARRAAGRVRRRRPRG